jgi:hypothetical protein
MKRIVIVSMIALVALAALSTGVVFAQGNQPPTPPRGPLQGGSEGPLHDYMVKALAEALGISADQLETRLDNGESAYQIALSQGIAAQDIPALLTAAHAKALDSALAAGVISQQQADWMKSRGFGRMGGMGNGSCGGTGRSQMERGGRWQPTNP